jgi:Gpi18-like mannosyltransferase
VKKQGNILKGFLRLHSAGLVLNCLFLAGAFGLFLVLSYPGNTQHLSVERIEDFSDPTSINKLEHDPKGQPYVWTKESTYFVFETLPRFLPLTITVDMNLQRPDGEVPAHLVVTEVNQSTYAPLQTIATFDYDPKQPGVRQYTLQVPASPDLLTGLDLEFKTNTFGVPGDTRVLGVTVLNFTITTNGDPWSGLLAPYPVGLAVALLLLIMATWFRLARLGWFESAVFLAMIAITCAEQVQFLRLASWLLLLCSTGLAACLIGWWLTRRALKVRFEFYWALAAVALLVIFFLPGDDFSFDTNLYRDWMHDLMQYGPFDFYAHSPSFNYLPLIIYIFWVYGHFMALFGIDGGDSVPFRVFMSLFVLACAWLIQRLAWPGASRFRRIAVPVIMLFGFNLAVLYNPTIWGQADVVLAFLLLVTFWLLQRRRFIPAGIMLGLSILFKPQAVFVVPLLAVVLLKQAGWRKAGLGLGLGALICTALALPSFGFRWSEIHQYIFQEQLVGQYVVNGTIRAYNLPFLFEKPEQLATITNAGLGIVAVTFAALALYLWRGKTQPGSIALAAALGVTTFFAFSIKMHERYLYYALPFLALAVAYAWQEKPGWFARMTGWFTAVYSLVALLEMLVSRHVDLSGQIEENLFNWNVFLIQNRDTLETGLSYAVIGLYLWGSGLFWLGAWFNRQSRLDRVIRPAVPGDTVDGVDRQAETAGAGLREVETIQKS